MPSKENYCYKIMKQHSLIVDFEGNPSRKNVPALKEGETFKQLTQRVLGDEVTNVVVYVPEKPAPQKKISTLQNISGAQHLNKIFNAFGNNKDRKKNEAVEKAVTEITQELVTFPKDTLEKLLDNYYDSDPLLYEAFQKFLDSKEENINT